MRLSDDRIHRVMRICYQNAKSSDDRKTQLGSVLVVDSVEVSGWNHFAVPLKEYPDDKNKARLMVHAEADAIARAAKHGMRIAGATLVCPWAPCCQCAKSIITSGIKTLVTHKAMMNRTYEKYAEEIEFGLRMLFSAGVEHVNWNGVVGGVDNLMNGEVWNP